MNISEEAVLRIAVMRLEQFLYERSLEPRAVLTLANPVRIDHLVDKAIALVHPLLLDER